MVKSNNFINIDTDKLTKLVADDTKKIIYIGRPTCHPCVEMESILKKVLKEECINIYYYDTKKAREEEFKAFDKIKKELNAQYIPLLLHYEGSQEINRLDYYDFVESEDNISKFIKNTIKM